MSESLPEPMTASDRRVLLVDDDEHLLAASARRLRKAFDVAVETDPLTALSRLSKDGAYAAIVADFYMGPMDGGAFLARASELAPDAVPILMTGAREAEVAAAVVDRVDIFRLLLKPVPTEVLDATLEAAVRQHELVVSERTHRERLRREHDRYDDLLRRVFPADVAERLRDEGTLPPRRLDDVAILFADLVEFTPYCETRPSEVVVEQLQRVMCNFEAVAAASGLQKIKTIGDAFMAIARPAPTPQRAVGACVEAGLSMISCAAVSEGGWRVRVGVHVGTVTAALIGRAQFGYDVFGDAVNTAYRTTQYGSPGGVTLSEEAARHLAPDVPATPLEPVRIKGKGLRRLHRVEAATVRPGP